MKHVLKVVIILFVILTSSLANSEEAIRDYYSEPGLHPYKETLEQGFNESIDPFGGGLQLKNVDWVLPGNGGMDIVIQRTYTLPQNALYEKSYVGAGWSIHFGKLFVPVYNNLCNQTFDEAVNNNPVLELSDGSREVFYRSTTAGIYMISANRWKAECIGTNPTNGMIITSPAGTKYTLGARLENTVLSSAPTVFYTSKIEDLYNNSLTIDYDPASSASAFIRKITARDGSGISDGRVVDFEYSTDNGDTSYLYKRLLYIKYNNVNRVQYVYREAPIGLSSPSYLLRSVQTYDPQATCWRQSKNFDSDCQSGWQYEYSSFADSYVGEDPVLLSKVTYPNGGEITYSYIEKAFGNPALFNTKKRTIVVDEKIQSGVNIQSARWKFTYNPSLNLGGDDSTQVDIYVPSNGGIDRSYRYTHIGLSSVSNTVVGNINGNLWQIGLLKKKEILNGVGMVLQTETNEWSSQEISNDNYFRQWGGYDLTTKVPVLTKRTINRDSTNYVTEFPVTSYDLYGNPTQKIERGFDGTNSTLKTSSYTYYINTTNWIVNLLKNETTTVGSETATVVRNYFSTGKLQSETNENGITTQYIYTTDGDINRVTDALGNSTTFSSYYRGIARNETHPVSSGKNITISRVVNAEGTVRSKTNGRVITTSFGYDIANRLTSINYPINNDVTINWNYNTPGNKILTRGKYVETVNVGGFGRPQNVTRTDTSLSESITNTTQYDVLGNVSFKSYPNNTQGTSTTYDALGRVKTITHPDGSTQVYTYLPNNQVSIKNERNFTTTHTFRSFGNPDEKTLTATVSPEGITTTITRNILDDITTLSQGGKTRVFTYTTNYLLDNEFHPEKGTTSYTYDANGNTKTRTHNALITTYNYDWQNRLTFIDYPGSTPDVTNTYDDNNNLKSVSSAVSLREFNYDAMDNLTQNKITVDANAFAANFTYNGLDFNSTVTYPSGRVVSFSPDAFGRARSATPYIGSNGVSYYPEGFAQQITYGNGAITNFTLNASRRWLENITTSGLEGLYVNKNYTHDTMGNVENISDSLDPNKNISNLTYDGVNRLRTGNSPQFGNFDIQYDNRGNIQTKTFNTSSLNYNYDQTTDRLSSVSGSKSQTYGYDAYGNISTNGANNFTFNDAGDLTTISGAVSHSYSYDGNNSRVKATRNGQITYYLYVNNNLLGEYNSSGTMLRENIYLGSKHIATTSLVPDVPGVVSITPPDATNSYTLSWSGVTDSITKYEVTANSTPSCIGGTTVYSGATPSYTVSNQVGGTYYYCARACNETGCGEYSLTGASSCAAIGASARPCIPSNVSLAGVTWQNTSGADSSYGRSLDGSYQVIWQLPPTNTVENLTHYEVRENGPTESVSTDYPVNAIINGAQSTQNYATISKSNSGLFYYRVRACNNLLCSDYINVNPYAIVDVETPPLPTSFTLPSSVGESAPGVPLPYNVSYVSGQNLSATYSWWVSVLTRATQANFSDEVIIQQNGSQPNPTFTDTVTISGQAPGYYYYRVRNCVKTNLSKCATSTALSGKIKVGVLPSEPPTQMNATRSRSGTNTIDKVVWNTGSDNPTSYILEVSTGGAYSQIYQGANLSVDYTTVQGAAMPTRYRVKACNAVGCGQYIETGVFDPVIMIIINTLLLD